MRGEFELDRTPLRPARRRLRGRLRPQRRCGRDPAAARSRSGLHQRHHLDRRALPARRPGRGRRAQAAAREPVRPRRDGRPAGGLSAEHRLSAGRRGGLDRRFRPWAGGRSGKLRHSAVGRRHDAHAGRDRAVADGRRLGAPRTLPAPGRRGALATGSTSPAGSAMPPSACKPRAGRCATSSIRTRGQAWSTATAGRARGSRWATACWPAIWPRPPSMSPTACWPIWPTCARRRGWARR